MPTLLYNPGIRIGITTRSGQTIDVSDDIQAGSLTLNENTLHSLSFTLMNTNGKYTGIFTPNDRIVVQMKRVQWLQTFSGYLNSVPYFTTFNTSVNLSASCTLKRIYYHFWDPGYIQTLQFLQNALENQNTTPDAGMSQVITQLLTGIIGWDPAQIHIGSIPSDWLKQIAGLWSDVENAISQSNALLGGLIVGGATGTGQGSIVPPNLNGSAPPLGVDLPTTSGTANVYSAASDWESQVNWPYFASNSASETKAAQQYLAGPDGTGQRLLVANANTGKTIVVQTNNGSASQTGAIGLSSTAMKQLGFAGSSGQVSIAWAPVSPTPSLGAYSVTAPVLSTKSTGASQSGLSTGPAGQLLQGNWLPIEGANPLSSELTGLRALMNDTPIFPTFTAIANTALRQFCAAPNGDFIAWFPDYFGLYGTAAVYNLSPIEMQDFSVQWSDDNLITHEFTAGSFAGQQMNTSANPQANGSSVTGTNMLMSYGIATIDVPGLFQALFGTSSSDGGLFGEGVPNSIYQQFGPRPNFDQMPTVAYGEAEFWYAVHNWQMSWASQFSTNLSLTFMPELFPGMLLKISEFNFQAYVHSVTHSWDLSSSGGFSTSVNIIAPSDGSGHNAGLIGLARTG